MEVGWATTGWGDFEIAIIRCKSAAADFFVFDFPFAFEILLEI
jgi:hypothetical protein